MRALRAILVVAILLALAVPFWNVLLPVEADDGGDTVELDLRYGILDMSVDVPSDLGEQYASSLVPRFGLEEYRLYTFVTPDDPAVRALADRIESITQLGGDRMRADVALSIVHENVAYATDQEMHGVSDYWQYPAETLLSGKGDCEDQALLLASLLEALGMDTVLVIEPGHASVGVCTGNSDGSTDHTERQLLQTVGIIQPRNCSGPDHRHNNRVHHHINLINTGTENPRSNTFEQNFDIFAFYKSKEIILQFYFYPFFFQKIIKPPNFEHPCNGHTESNPINGGIDKRHKYPYCGNHHQIENNRSGGRSGKFAERVQNSRLERNNRH